MVGAPGLWAACPCSTVHRLRMSEFRRDFESQSCGSPVRISRGKGNGRLVSVSARSNREGRRNGQPKDSDDCRGGGGFQSSMLGLVALASPALLLSSDANADVIRPVEESKRMRIEMLESIKTRAKSQNLVREDPPSTVAPPLSNKMVAPTKVVEEAGPLEPEAGSPFGFLNGAVGSGIVGSGILGALYGRSKRARTTSNTPAPAEVAKSRPNKPQVNFRSGTRLVKGGTRMATVRAPSKRDVRRNAKPKYREDKGGGGFSKKSLLGLVALAAPALLISAGAKSDVMPPVNESEKMRLEMLETIEKRVKQSNAETKIQGPAAAVAPPLKYETREPVKRSKEALEVPETSSTVQDEPVSGFKQPSTLLIPAPTVSDANPPVEASPSGLETQPELPTQSGNPFGFLSGFGIVGSGILGALYWLEGQAKTASKTALTEAKTKLDQSQAAMATMKKQLENELYDQRSDSTKKLLQEEEQRSALADELTMAKSAAKELQLQLESQINVNQNLEKKVKSYQTSVKELEGNVQSLEGNVQALEGNVQALEGNVQALEDKLVQEKDKLVQEKDKLAQEEQKRYALEAELRNELAELLKKQEATEQELFSTKGTLTEAEDKVQSLAKDLIVSQSCFEERGDTVHRLEKALADATSRAEEAEENLVALQREMSELEESTMKRLESLNATLTSKLNDVRELNLELEKVRGEAGEAASNVEKFRLEVEQLECNLAKEQESVQKLADELEALQKQKLESEGDAEAKLRSLRESLHAEQVTTSQLQLELADARASLQASTSESKSFSEKLNDTLLVNKRIQDELDEVRRTAEETLVSLTEEKKKVASAEKQFIETQKALAREEILVQSLRSEFSKAMDAMNDLRKHLSSLSKDLQDANVKIAALETEKAVLQQSVANEKKTAKRFKEKAVNAESELAKLVQEKEGSVSKARKLEHELSSAEKEMGSLKQQMLVMGNVIDSAELRMGSIQQVNAEVASLLKKIDGSKAEQKQTRHQMDRLKEQSKAASEITKELKSMKKLLSHFQQNLDEAELDRVEAEAALQDAVRRSIDDDQQRAAPVYSS